MNHRWLRICLRLGLPVLLAALTAPSLAAAQGAPASRSRDGKSLDSEPSSTQALFQAAYGADAPLQWRIEHDIATRSDLAQAADGTTLQTESNPSRVAFIQAFGTQAATSWAVIHTGAIGRAIILTGDLEEAVEAAENGNLTEAQSEFKQFSTAWENNFERLVRARSDAIADDVANQLHAVSGVLITPSSPDKTRVVDELHKFAGIVDDARDKLDAMPTGAPVAITLASAAATAAIAAPAAGASGAASGPKLSVTIDTGELESSITGVAENNSLRVRGELQEFFEAWDEVKAAVQKENPTAFDEITADLEAARASVLDRSRATLPVAEYLPALQKALATIRKYQ